MTLQVLVLLAALGDPEPAMVPVPFPTQGTTTTSQPPPPPPPPAPAPAPASSGAAAQPAPAPAPAPTPSGQPMGGVTSPAALPAGTLALYGLVGAPDVIAGYRQGFNVANNPFELEVKALFNYLQVSFKLEVGAKLAVYRTERLSFAPGLAVGFVPNTGAKYFDTSNFGFVGLQLRPNATLTYLLADIVQGIAMLELPWTIALGQLGFQLAPLFGLGAEFQVGPKLTLIATGHIGVDTIKEPLGVAQVRVAWGVRLGLGYRVF